VTGSDTQAESGGYMFALPYLARANYTAEGMAVLPAPWGGPIASAITGKDQKGQWLGIINESPVGWIRPVTPLSDKEIELIHLNRLATDWRAATGENMFDAILEEREKPDLIVSAHGQSVGIEMTTFSIERRRKAQGLFFGLTSRLAKQPRHRLGHLSGYQIFVWFGGDDDSAGLPFNRNAAESFDELVEAIVAHSPSPQEHLVPGDELPQTLDRAGLVRTPNDVQFFSIPLLGGVPNSPFYALTGMHVALAYQSDHSASAEWRDLRKRVERKDVVENNAVVISVGAPDKFGRCFVAEEMLADLLLSSPEATKTEHLKSIILHFWSTGRAIQLIGNDGPTEMWPALYSGTVPSFQQFPSPDGRPNT
jgi:hypothetical protein